MKPAIVLGLLGVVVVAVLVAYRWFENRRRLDALVRIGQAFGVERRRGESVQAFRERIERSMRGPEPFTFETLKEMIRDTARSVKGVEVEVAGPGHVIARCRGISPKDLEAARDMVMRHAPVTVAVDVEAA